MKHTQNIDLLLDLYQIGDSIMSIKQNTNFTLWSGTILVTDFGEFLEQLSFSINTGNHLIGGI